MNLNNQRVLLDGAEAKLFQLVLKGATPEQWAEWLRAPLEHAATSGNFSLVDRLLRAGADGSAGWRGCRGRSLLDAAATGGSGDVVSALLRAGCGADCGPREQNQLASMLELAAKHGHTEVVKVLLDHGADVNDADTLGWTALHFAAEDNQAKTADVLMIAGADINATEHMGRTPIHYAAAWSSNDVLRGLLRRGAKTNEADLDGRTALHFVCAQRPGHAIETVDLLLRAGASEIAVDERGNTPADVMREATDVADEQAVQRIREVLRRAPANRAWRRRSWLVLLRARAEQERAARSVNNSSNSGAMGVVGGRVLGGGRGGNSSWNRER